MLAKEKKIKNVFVPHVNSSEAALIKGVKNFPLESLVDLFYHLQGEKLIKAKNPTKLKNNFDSFDFDMQEIQAKEQAKRAMEIAAAKGPNIILKGPHRAARQTIDRRSPPI